jgi:hypothetical protein
LAEKVFMGLNGFAEKGVIVCQGCSAVKPEAAPGAGYAAKKKRNSVELR